MIELNQLRPAVRALYEVAVKMETEGKEVTFSSLSNECGSHSKRDVSAALDLYRDEKRKIENSAYPMPEDINSKVQRLISLIWAEQCQWHNNQREHDKQILERQLTEARADRDKVFAENEMLSKANLELTKKINTLNNEIEKQKTNNGDLREQLNEASVTISGLKAKTEVQERSLKELYSALQSIRN